MTASFPQRVETTFGDLRPTDLVIDKAGQLWPVEGLEANGETVSFWLLDQTSKIRMHQMTKRAGDPVTVSRKQTHADDIATLEAEAEESLWPEVFSHDDAIANVRAKGGVVEATVTAEEIDQAKEAEATGEPAEIIPFDDMTNLERSSHLYLLHGVFATDVQSRADLARMHDEAHRQHAAGKLNGRHTPHVHVDSVSTQS